jgi:hypothetical protein
MLGTAEGDSPGGYSRPLAPPVKVGDRHGSTSERRLGCFVNEWGRRQALSGSRRPQPTAFEAPRRPAADKIQRLSTRAVSYDEIWSWADRGGMRPSVLTEHRTAPPNICNDPVVNQRPEKHQTRRNDHSRDCVLAYTFFD